MKLKNLLAMSIGMLVVASIIALPSNYASAQLGIEKRTPTVLTMEMSGCVTLTCGAQYLVGDTVTFKGRLTTADGEPVRDAQINIIKFIPKPEFIIIASGVTGIDGDFELSWNATFTNTEKLKNDVTKKIVTETVTIYADFAGDQNHAPSRSSKNTATITVNELNISINSDSGTYEQGDTATVFIAVIDSEKRLVDPDKIRVVVNDKDVEPEKMKEGSYRLVIESLAKEHNQIIVLIQKAGYNTNNGYLTLIVGGLK